jgi:hypothetical protein|tara:strand:+ start:1125 stop:1709 length:585 start_codon:yes stop_codon:yes gene_type:complete
MEQNKVYQSLSKISVKDKVEKKGRFDYLSWAWAWHYLQTNYPGSQRVVYETAEGVPYFTDGKFANVKVGIIVNGVEHIDYLPISDNLNRSIPLTKITSFEVNNAIQRSTAKAIAMHGLGLSLWIGEDIAVYDEPKKTQPKPKDNVLELNDEKWPSVLKYITANKDRGIEWIIENISKKYKISAKVKTEIKKQLK